MAGEVWRRDGDTQDWELSTLEGKKLSSFSLYFVFGKSCQCSFHHGSCLFVFMRDTVNFHLSNLVIKSVFSPSIGIFSLFWATQLKTFKDSHYFLFKLALVFSRLTRYISSLLLVITKTLLLKSF